VLVACITANIDVACTDLERTFYTSYNSAAFFAMLSCCSLTGCSIVKGVLVKMMAIGLRIGMFYYLFLRKVNNKEV
jgi:hypothetical protein